MGALAAARLGPVFFFPPAHACFQTSYAPDQMQFLERNTDSHAECVLNLELAFSVAQATFGVPKLLQPSDLLRAEGPQEMAVYGYLSSLYQALHKRKTAGKPPKSAGKMRSPAFFAAASPRIKLPTSPRRGEATSPRSDSTTPTSGKRLVSGQTLLLRWCHARMAGLYPADFVRNFREGWSNGLALCAIAACYYPEAINFSALSVKTGADCHRNVALALHVLETRGGVPRLLEAEDITGHTTDPQSLMTYLSTARRILDELSAAQSPPPIVSPTVRAELGNVRE